MIQGSTLVNLIPTLRDKTFLTGHCYVAFHVCSVVILCKLWVVPSTFVKAPLHERRWVQSLVGVDPSMAPVGGQQFCMVGYSHCDYNLDLLSCTTWV